MNRLSFRWIGRVFIIFLLFHMNYSFAGEKEHLFTEGNKFYQEGKYLEALNAYKKILEMGYESGSLYYNIGNCYYKIHDVGRAILYYERARKLIPDDEDLKANLKLANLSVVDKINPRPQFILFRIVDAFLYILPKSVLIWGVIGLYLIFMATFVLWVISRKRMVKLVTLRMIAFWGVLLIVFGLSVIGRLEEEKKKIYGIILVQKVNVMSAPSQEEGVEVFSLHEGTKVQVDKKSDGWVEIVLADGKVGWVKRDVLEII